MALAEDVLIRVASTCSAGHALVGDNVIWATDKRDNKTRPRCRLCRNEQAAEARRRKRANRTEANARTCPSGHLIFGDNAVALRTSTGKTYLACRTCRTAAVARVRAKKKGEAMLTSLQPDAEFATVQVWTALGASPLRDRVAVVLMTKQPPDPLVAAVIKRAARKRVWNRIGAHFAAIALCEALIEEVRDAQSPRLRLDRVLAYLLG